MISVSIDFEQAVATAARMPIFVPMLELGVFENPPLGFRLPALYWVVFSPSSFLGGPFKREQFYGDRLLTP